MARRSKTRQDRPVALPAERPVRLEPDARHLIADVRNDVTIPYWSGVLSPLDDTLISRGAGKGLKLYDEIERDTHAYAMLQKRKKVLISRDWVVEPASDEALDVEAADGAEQLLNVIAFDRMCEDLLDATLKGFAVIEIVWGAQGGRMMPIQLVAHDQRRFVFDADWRLRLLTRANLREGIELPDRKFIVHRHGVKGNNPYGLGLGTRLFWPVLFKREGIAFWLHFLEKFAGPTAVATTPYGMLPEESRRLLNTLADIRTSGAITVPVGTDLKFLEASRSGSVTYSDFLSYWDTQISICVTGETLTTQLGSVGSNAAAQTHIEILELLVDSDADLLADTLHTTLLTWFVELNWPGARAPYVRRPRPENRIEEAQAREAEAKAVVARGDALERLMTATAAIEDDATAARLMARLASGEAYDEADLTAIAAARRQATPRQPAPPNRPDAGGDASDGEGEDEGEGEPAFAHACFADPDSASARVAERLIAGPVAQHLARRLTDLRAALDGAGDFEGAGRALLDLAASWATTRSAAELGQGLGDALELAARLGRADVRADVQGETASFSDAGGPLSQPFAEQLEFLRQKQPLPSGPWTDFMQGQHDRAFVVAGALDQALVEDFQTAVLRGVETGDYRAFAADFDAIVARHGWAYNGGRDWRIRTIFETNVRTSYMAGRLRQMRDPDVVTLRPYWRYLHGDTRTPANPRPQHVSWDGLVLRHDDPWWDTHFPPNDWRCSCGVETLSEDDLMALGKTGPDEAPRIQWESVTDRQTGRPTRKPKGVGVGWDYQPGDLWSRGLVPQALMPKDDPSLPRGRSLVSIDEAPTLRSRPFAQELLSTTDEPETAVARFLEVFETTIGRPVRFEDKAGASLIISDELFRDRNGAWKAMKRGRDAHLLRLAETIRDPDEIWVGVAEVLVKGRIKRTVDRRYVRSDGVDALFAVFEADRWAWEPVTSFAARLGARGQSSSLVARRSGKLVWRRE